MTGPNSRERPASGEPLLLPKALPQPPGKRAVNYRPFVRRDVLAGALLVLAAVAAAAFSGALQQLPRSQSVGQRIETAVQVACSLLSLLAGITCFWGRRWAARVRSAWAVSLASTTGLSAVVWGPPMLVVALLFSAGPLLVALAFNRILRWAQDA